MVSDALHGPAAGARTNRRAAQATAGHGRRVALGAVDMLDTATLGKHDVLLHRDGLAALPAFRLWGHAGKACLRWISNSFWSLVTGRAQTEQVAPTPSPPQVRSGVRLGSLPLWTAARAFSRRTGSSGIWLSSTARWSAERVV